MNTQTKVYYPEVATKALEVLKGAGYFPKVVGYGEIDKPRYEKGWLLDPVTDVHPYAKRGVEALTQAHTPILGYVLAHELEFIVTDEPKKQDFKVESDNILPAVSTGAAIFATLALGVLSLFVYALANFDPSFIVVLDDPEKTWIEIVNWRS